MKSLLSYIFVGGTAAAAAITAAIYLPPLVFTYGKSVLSGDGVLEAIVGMFVLGLGTVLYLIREQHRHLYGAAELSFGVTMAMYSASKFRNELFSIDLNHLGHWSGSISYLPWLTIFACVYIVVNGLENVVVGDEELRKKFGQHKGENGKYTDQGDV